MGEKAINNNSSLFCHLFLTVFCLIKGFQVINSDGVITRFFDSSEQGMVILYDK